MSTKIPMPNAQTSESEEGENLPIVENTGEDMISAKGKAVHISPVDNVEALPMSILSKSEYFDQLFDLLERDDKYGCHNCELIPLARKYTPRIVIFSLQLLI